MRTLRSLWLWTAGGLYMLGVLSGIIVVSYLLPAKSYDPWLKKAMRGLFRILGVQVEVRGPEHIPRDRPCLFMANHVSLFDIPLLAGYIPQFVRGIEADRQFRWPLYGWALRRAGNIPISRSSPVRARRSFEIALLRLRAGQSLVVLPEGHRTMDGRLRPFKILPFHFAKQAAVPIVPVGLSGLFRLKPKTTWHITPTPLRIAFGPPIAVEEIQALSPQQLAKRVRDAIEALVLYP